MKRTENGKKLQIKIEADADGMKLEHYLRRRLLFTKAQIKSMKFRENGLTADGERVRINHVLRAGERLEIMLEDAGTSSQCLEQNEQPVEILYEDDDLIAVWKEAGLVLHPSHGHYRDTLSNRVHTYFTKQNRSVMIRSIGRLDRDTRGIVVFAKNQVAAARLWEQKENGIFWKEYLAVCSGIIDTGKQNTAQQDASKVVRGNEKKADNLAEGSACWHTISAPIAKLPGDLMRMCVSEEGKPAVTHYQVLRKMEDSTLVRVRIETGRTHQIRVHMASVGHPLVGDVLYGIRENVEKYEKKEQQRGEKKKTSMYLCAWRAELEQPFSGEKIKLECRISEDFLREDKTGAQNFRGFPAGR